MKKLFLILALLLVAGMVFAGGQKYFWTCSATCKDNPKKYMSACAEYDFQAQTQAGRVLCECGNTEDFIACDRTIYCIERSTKCQ